MLARFLVLPLLLVLPEFCVQIGEGRSKTHYCSVCDDVVQKRAFGTNCHRNAYHDSHPLLLIKRRWSTIDDARRRVLSSCSSCCFYAVPVSRNHAESFRRTTEVAAHCRAGGLPTTPAARRSTLSDRAFPAAVSTWSKAWNSLPSTTGTAASLSIFLSVTPDSVLSVVVWLPRLRRGYCVPAIMLVYIGASVHLPGLATCPRNAFVRINISQYKSVTHNLLFRIPAVPSIEKYLRSYKLYTFWGCKVLSYWTLYCFDFFY